MLNLATINFTYNKALYIMRLLLSVCLTVLCSYAPSGFASGMTGENIQGPAFDCDRATHAAEKMICADARLSALDRELNRRYESAMATARFTSQLRNHQLYWLYQVRNACEDIACLQDVYLWRIAMLDDSPRFVARDDGLVLDKKTGLMWMRCSVGQQWDGETCAGRVDTLYWRKAMELAAASTFAGMQDWRVPVIHELDTLVYCSSNIREQPKPEGYHGECAGDYKQPTIDTDVFPRAPVAYVWSTSAVTTQATGAAWQVYFNYGGSRYISTDSLSGASARFVRGGY